MFGPENEWPKQVQQERRVSTCSSMLISRRLHQDKDLQIHSELPMGTGVEAGTCGHDPVNQVPPRKGAVFVFCPFQIAKGASKQSPTRPGDPATEVQPSIQV